MKIPWIRKERLRQRTLRWVTNKGFFPFELKDGSVWDVLAHDMGDRFLLIREQADEIRKVEYLKLLRFPCPARFQKLVLLWSRKDTQPRMVEFPTEQAEMAPHQFPSPSGL